MTMKKTMKSNIAWRRSVVRTSRDKVEVCKAKSYEILVVTNKL